MNIFKVSLQAHAEVPELASKSLFGEVVDCETSVQETQLLPSNDSKYRSFEPGSVKHLQVPDESEKGFRIRNRYRRGLETCSQAETSKSEHTIFFYFFRRVRATSMNQRRVKNTRVHF